MDNKKLSKKETILSLFTVASLMLLITLYLTTNLFDKIYLIFWIILIIIFSGSMALKLMMNNSKKFSMISKEDINKYVVKLIIIYSFHDLTFLMFFKGHIILKLIFGICSLIIIFYNLVCNFLNNYHDKLKNSSNIVDFIIGICITIYLIHIIPSNDIKNIVIPLISAVYGGLITLVGVALTIKKSDSNRKEEEKLKNRPLIAIKSIDDSDEQCVDDEINLILINNKCISEVKNKNNYIFCPFSIQNLDYSYCCFRGIAINEDVILYLITGKILKKNTGYNIDFSDVKNNYDKEFTEVKIILEDVLGNHYVLNSSIGIKEENNVKYISIIGGIEYLSIKIDIDNFKISGGRKI